MAIKAIIGAVGVLLTALSSHAADTLTYGPPASWVVSAPPAAIPPDDGASARLLLLDEQLRYTPKEASAYTETRLLIERSQGVTALGPVMLSWDPYNTDLVVHDIRLIRDRRSIDLLAGHPMTVLRREASLEGAVLDGVLTATLQPADVRVGDILDIAYTIIRRDKLLDGQAEAWFDIANVPIDDLRLTVASDQAVPFRWRATNGLGPMTESRHGGWEQVSTRMTNLQPLRLPTGAPTRFLQPRTLEITNATSWADAVAFMQPLYAKAVRIAADSPLRMLIAHIRAQSADPLVRAEAALALVQDQVRYVAIGLEDGGIVPAAADLTWSRRFGDCKGKTALLTALLGQLGITAEPVLVSVARGDGLLDHLPSWRWFDHVMVRAVIRGRVYWLDGTRSGDRHLADIPVPQFHWAVPIGSGPSQPIALVGRDVSRPDLLESILIDDSAGLEAPARVQAEARFHGDGAVALNRELTSLRPADREVGLRRYWTKRLDGIEASLVDATYDASTEDERLTLKGSEVLDWEPVYGSDARHYRADCLPLRIDVAGFRREAGANGDAPFAVPWPSLIESNEKIMLPRHGAGFRVEGPDINERVAGRAIMRQASIQDGVFTAHETLHSLTAEFPASEVPSAVRTLRSLEAADLYVRAPPTVHPLVSTSVTGADHGGRPSPERLIR